MTLTRFVTLTLSTLLLLMFAFTACQKDRLEEVAGPQQSAESSNYFTPQLTDFLTDRSGYWTEIPAGSVDMLNQAIAEADEGGVIYLKAGMHTETGRVTVDKRVAIIGEDGAVLRISSPDTTAIVNPGLYVLDAPGTLVKNLVIEPIETNGWTAVMFENSPGSAVLQSQITKFNRAIIIEQSDRIAIIANHFIACANNAVLAVNGKSTYIADNEIEGSGIGTWLCDEWGTLERNNFHDNVNGVLLCNWPAEFGVLKPDGSPLDAQITCIGWKLRDNLFTNQDFAGLAIRDGATLNLIENSNQYSSNGGYDIWIPADEWVIPPDVLFAPAALNNTIHATPAVKIKDCGIDNVINGGTLVDTSQDPC